MSDPVEASPVQEIVRWPNFCDCGKEATHHLFIDVEKTVYSHLCDDCLYVWLANRAIDNVVLSRT